MSQFYKPCLYNNRGKENQLKNLCYQGHDLICGCTDPTKHLQFLFGICPTSTTTTEDPITTLTDAVDGLEDGDLERMFSENFTEDDER